METLDELDEALEDLREERLEEGVDVSIEAELDGDTLVRLATRVDMLDGLLEVDGRCTLEGRIEPDDLEGPGLRERLDRVAERVDDLSRDLASMRD